MNKKPYVISKQNFLYVGPIDTNHVLQTFIFSKAKGKMSLFFLKVLHNGVHKNFKHLICIMFKHLFALVVRHDLRLI